MYGTGYINHIVQVSESSVLLTVARLCGIALRLENQIPLSLDLTQSRAALGIGIWLELHCATGNYVYVSIVYYAFNVTLFSGCYNTWSLLSLLVSQMAAVHSASLKFGCLELESRYWRLNFDLSPLERLTNIFMSYVATSVVLYNWLGVWAAPLWWLSCEGVSQESTLDPVKHPIALYGQCQ